MRFTDGDPDTYTFMAADEGKKVKVKVTFMDGDSYTVVLDTQPTGNVVVTVAGYVGTVVTPNRSTLTFTTSNWNTDRTVTVTVTDNDSDNSLEIGSNGELRLVNDNGPTTSEGRLEVFHKGEWGTVSDDRFDSDFIDRHSGSTALVENIAPQFACQQMGERSEDLDFRIRFGGERIEAADAEPEHRFGVQMSVHW